MDSDVALTGLPATRIAGKVRDGTLTARRVTLAHLARANHTDPVIRAFTALYAADALAQAEAVDARPDRGRLPLAGVPVAVKDDLDVVGYPTRHGSQAGSWTPAATDDPAVTRLREAGAVLLGKTALPELGLWPFTESDAFGATHNPWDPRRTPGGSTGGGAAAVAAAMAPLAVGSDGGGSLRIPAACCGLVGLKPGPGVVPLPGDRPRWRGLAQWGPLATTVGDAALLLDVLAGTPPLAVAVPQRRLRVATSVRPPALGVRVDGDCVAAVDATAEVLAAAGHTVRRADPPWGAADGWVFTRRFLAGAADHAREVGVDLALAEPRTRTTVRAGGLLDRLAPSRPQPVRALQRRLESFFADHDVVVTPTLTGPPLRVGALASSDTARTLVRSGAFIAFLPLVNLAGYPAASVPAGMSHAGLPVGVHLVAAVGEERRLLEVARLLELARPWPRHAPDTAMGGR